MKLLEPIQHGAAQAVAGTLRTVALPIALAEAGIAAEDPMEEAVDPPMGQPTHVAAKIPFREKRHRINVDNKRFVTPL
ncbi:uncharacterized protein Z518_09614 [Rhinocladiella mackenziei CBS 650.93]|uniref:Uncharacterized protein n=1 Tax=Rhinocladiella mackenziei CBS 650.93 TaxID=1442369 RepID=A0A0D2I464_9EURO|nr:uncharacterized protein Z518_09614 [Rhinocladiella mackenziei CBS 650.93]KIX00549.1 hypothetical protein Z518_09614 [Rhinocladiella mackenziei CBS 650.93]